jgi:hypothetical protein
MTKRPDTRCFMDPEDRSMPDSAIGNASGWPEIDLSLLDTIRGAAGAPVDDVVQALPAACQRTLGGSIRPFSPPRGGPADRRKRRKPNNMTRTAASPMTNGLQSRTGRFLLASCRRPDRSEGGWS